MPPRHTAVRKDFMMFGPALYRQVTYTLFASSGSSPADRPETSSRYRTWARASLSSVREALRKDESQRASTLISHESCTVRGGESEARRKRLVFGKHAPELDSRKLRCARACDPMRCGAVRDGADRGTENGMAVSAHRSRRLSQFLSFGRTTTSWWGGLGLAEGCDVHCCDKIGYADPGVNLE
jgi:hypothetical protein